MVHSLNDLAAAMQSDDDVAENVFTFAYGHNYFPGKSEEQAREEFYLGLSTPNPRMLGMLAHYLPTFNRNNPDQVDKAWESVTTSQRARDAAFDICYEGGLFGQAPAGQEEQHRNDAKRRYEADITQRGTAENYLRHAAPELRSARHNQTKFERAGAVAGLSLAALIGMFALSVSPESKRNISNIAGAAAIAAGIGIVGYGLSRRS